MLLDRRAEQDALLVAESSGDPALVGRAAERLRIGADAVTAPLAQRTQAAPRTARAPGRRLCLAVVGAVVVIDLAFSAHPALSIGIFVGAFAPILVGRLAFARRG